MSLTVRRQTFQGIQSWAIYDGETFLAYSLRRMGAHRAKQEIEASMIRCQPKRMTQREIDTRPMDQEPQGIFRRLVWRAARRGQ